MKQLLYVAILSLPLKMIAQGESNKKGIQWTEGLSWEQVKEKAKKENKYIFVDAYTTWCTPCKAMDRDVYPNDSIGNYFNDRFISVKVQMDKTAKDNEQVKSWYKDAETLQKQFLIEYYPCFVFLSPEGKIVHKAGGYKTVSDLVAIAKAAIVPGKTYDDEYEKYRLLAADYSNGNKDFDKMPYMITTAYKLGEIDFGKQLLYEHTDHVASLSPRERYTRENIEMWAGFTLKSDGKRFVFFYKDGDKIDKVMNKKGYAASVVDRTIQAEIVGPFYKDQPGGLLMSGGQRPVKMVNGNYVPVESEKIEADWEKLYSLIREKYSDSYAKRNVLQARIQWYSAHGDMESYRKYFFKKIEDYPPIVSNMTDPLLQDINGVAWDVFLNSKDKKLINSAIRWMEKLIAVDTIGVEYWMDTYANLLYKMGRTKEAINWEEKAINASKKSALGPLFLKQYEKTLEQMKRSVPTHDVKVLKQSFNN